MDNTIVRGHAGETLAAAYLQLVGCRLIGRNHRLGGVEVDLLAADGETQVIVEVKVRRRADYGGAALAVDRGKRNRLLRAARALGHSVPVRIDVVAVDLVEGGANVRHYPGAVSE